MWARITVAALAFALVVVVARKRTAPLPLLAVEAVMAGALGFVPPYLWGSWLNFHAFTLVALISRRDRSLWPLLAVEIVLAAALAFTPPHRWFDWFNWNELAAALSFEFIAPLAMSWFAIAVLTAVRQRTSRRPHAP